MVDVVNIDTENSKVNPVLKIKPLYGFGRVDFSVVLRQKTGYLVQVSLETLPEIANQFGVHVLQSELSSVIYVNLEGSYRSTFSQDFF